MRTLLYTFLAGTLLGGLGVSRAHGQCLTLDVDLNKRLSQSTLIVDGVVTAKHSFWSKGNIYTRNTLSLYQVFKGSHQPATLEVITLCGQVGTDILEVHPSLQLELGQAGYFMLKKWTDNTTYFETVFDAMGFVSYDQTTSTATDLYHSYGDIASEFLPMIKGRLNSETQTKSKAFLQRH